MVRLFRTWVAVVAVGLGLLALVFLLGGPWIPGPAPTSPGGAVLHPGATIGITRSVGFQVQCVLREGPTPPEVLSAQTCPLEAEMRLFAHNGSEQDWYLSVVARTPTGAMEPVIPGLAASEAVWLRERTAIRPVGNGFPVGRMGGRGTYGLHGVFTREPPDMDRIVGSLGEGKPPAPDAIVVLRVVHVGERPSIPPPPATSPPPPGARAPLAPAPPAAAR